MLFPDKKALIVDVDGTLYNQKKLRIYMLFRLLIYYFSHFWKIKELIGIFLFRKYRYKDVYKSLSNNELVDIIADKLHTSRYTISDARHYWMDIFPLKYLAKYKYYDFVRWLNNGERNVYVYSDYETAAKLDALRLRYSDAFYPDGKNILSVKPDKQSMSYILNKIGISKEYILYIGDDDKKDGESAKLVDIDYLNIKDVLKYM